jgi:signal peptidase I
VIRALRLVVTEVVWPLLLAVVLALFIQSTVAKPYEIPTGSMSPTIRPDERVLANRFIYRLRDVRRSDIIVFLPPPEVGSQVPFVKRVVGLPGDTVEVRDGQVLVNEDVFHVPEASAPLYGYQRRLVPQGMLFVLGDNRNNSVDSHQWGFVAQESVLGEVFMTYWPLSRLRLL